MEYRVTSAHADSPDSTSSADPSPPRRVSTHRFGQMSLISQRALRPVLEHVTDVENQGTACRNQEQ